MYLASPENERCHLTARNELGVIAVCNPSLDAFELTYHLPDSSFSVTSGMMIGLSSPGYSDSQFSEMDRLAVQLGAKVKKYSILKGAR